MVQLHKKFTDDQVKQFFKRYVNKELERKYIQSIFKIKKRRFFELLKQYRENPEEFSIQYNRSKPTRKIPQHIEKVILKELSEEQKLILDKDINIDSYNYSHIKDILQGEYDYSVSLPTIISRAKSHGYYIKKKTKKNDHDRLVLTKNTGELVQQDASYHKFSPYSDKKWTLVTALDDYSRFIFFAVLVEKESSWQHILATEHIVLNYGIPLAYYTDSHSIFRFVQKRDSIWRNHYKLTDDVDPQWLQVVKDLNIEPIYALSPQAKGKVERPYRWIQDRLVRICARKNITDIKQAQKELNKLILSYNYKWVHSTTKEIPNLRLQRAFRENKNLFREFSVEPPFKSTKDIFCFRVDRMIDSYRRVSLDNIKFEPRNAVPHKRVKLRIAPINKAAAEIRFWCDKELIDVQKTKISNLKSVHF